MSGFSVTMENDSTVETAFRKMCTSVKKAITERKDSPTQSSPDEDENEAHSIRDSSRTDYFVALERKLRSEAHNNELRMEEKFNRRERELLKYYDERESKLKQSERYVAEDVDWCEKKRTQLIAFKRELTAWEGDIINWVKHMKSLDSVQINDEHFQKMNIMFKKWEFNLRRREQVLVHSAGKNNPFPYGSEEENNPHSSEQYSQEAARTAQSQGDG